MSDASQLTQQMQAGVGEGTDSSHMPPRSHPTSNLSSLKKRSRGIDKMIYHHGSQETNRLGSGRLVGQSPGLILHSTCWNVQICQSPWFEPKSEHWFCFYFFLLFSE